MIYFNSPYEVVKAQSPAEYPIPCYGVLNKDTGVIEAYIGQLARAKQFADQFAKDLREGLKSDEDQLSRIFGALKATPGDFGSGGGLNG